MKDLAAAFSLPPPHHNMLLVMEDQDDCDLSLHVSSKPSSQKQLAVSVLAWWTGGGDSAAPTQLRSDAKATNSPPG